MIDYQRLYNTLDELGLAEWQSLIENQLEFVWRERLHGEFITKYNIVKNLPKLTAKQVSFDQKAVSIQGKKSLSNKEQTLLKQQLLQLSPWRKGPYHIHGIDINTEWRSDLKWQRLKSAIHPLKDRLVLDVGCGNGYHCWRMANESPKLVLGIDPSQFFLCQFLALEHFIGQQYPVYILPFGIEQMPTQMSVFDSVFSMGILYHRRSPIDHLTDLRNLLNKGGELILETLVIEGDDQQVLVPKGRYAKMRNVWFIPSIKMLMNWLSRVGFQKIKCIDVSITSIEEQRSTEWMQFESLVDYLDPNDLSKTIEGYPAPKRAVIIAKNQ